MRFKTILLLIFTTLIVVFSIQNVAITPVKFLLWEMAVSRVVVIIGSFSIGVVVGILVSLKLGAAKKSTDRATSNTINQINK